MARQYEQLEEQRRLKEGVAPSMREVKSAVAAMQPETLARVWDAIDRMVHNKLGLHLVRSCKIGNLCYMLEKGGENAVHDKAGRQLREKLLESCNDGQPIRLTDGIGQSGDGYIAMALVLAGQADEDLLKEAKPSEFRLGPESSVKAAWASCVDFAWVKEVPAPSLPARARDGARACTATARASDESMGVYPAGVLLGMYASALQDQQVTGQPRKINFAEQLREITDLLVRFGGSPKYVTILRDSARIVLPHAGHSKASGYTRNYIFVSNDVVHADAHAHAHAHASLVTQPDGGSAKQSELLKLIMPGNRTGMMTEFDIRCSRMYRNYVDTSMMLDYFFAAPFEQTRELWLALVVQIGDAATPSASQCCSLDESVVLATLHATDDCPAAKAFIMPALMKAQNLQADAAEASPPHFVLNAFAACPMFQRFCEVNCKPALIEMMA
tara:strand:- start:37 stop:1365 length:1329 start_codon:yes stop_codon:yes gene_type:complete